MDFQNPSNWIVDDELVFVASGNGYRAGDVVTIVGALEDDQYVTVSLLNPDSGRVADPVKVSTVWLAFKRRDNIRVAKRELAVIEDRLVQLEAIRKVLQSQAIDLRTSIQTVGPKREWASGDVVQMIGGPLVGQTFTLGSFSSMSNCFVSTETLSGRTVMISITELQTHGKLRVAYAGETQHLLQATNPFIEASAKASKIIAEDEWMVP